MGQNDDVPIFDAVVPNAGKLTVLDPNAKALPQHLSFDAAVSLVVLNRGTVKERILNSTLWQNVQRVSADDRSRMHQLAAAGALSKESALAFYSSHLIEELNADEASLLRTYGDTGKSIFVAKSKAISRAVRELLDKVERSISFVEALEKVKGIEGHLDALRAGLADVETRIVSARMLQALGHQDESTDAVIMDAVKAKKRDGKWSESLVAEYIERNLAPTKAFREFVIEHAFSAGTLEIPSAARHFLSRGGKPDAALTKRLIEKAATLERQTARIRIAGIFFDHGEAPPLAQIIYLGVIGDSYWQQEAFKRDIHGLKAIDRAALQWVAEKIEKDDADRAWELTKLVRDAKNIAGQDLLGVFEPLLESTSENTRIRAARVLASHGLLSPKIEAIIFGEAGTSRTWEKTALSLDSRFQLSASSRDRMISKIENRDVPDFARAILLLQKELSPEHIDRLKALQENGMIPARQQAAAVLLKRGLGNAGTLEALIAGMGPSAELSQSELVTHLYEALNALPVSDKALVLLVVAKRLSPLAYAKIKQLVPEREPRLAGVAQEDLRLYLRLAGVNEMVALNAQEAEALARLIANGAFPNAGHAYELLKRYSGGLAARSIFEAGVASSSKTTRFYSALALANRFGQWNEEVQNALLPWLEFSDVPIQKTWSSEILKGELPLLSRESSPRSNKVKEILSRSTLDQATIGKLLDLARDPSQSYGYVAKDVLMANESAQVDDRVRKYLGLGPLKKGNQTHVDYWIHEMEAGTRLNDAAKHLRGYEWNPSELSRVEALLSSNDLARRVAAAVSLEDRGVWIPAVEAVFSAVSTGTQTIGSWNEKYFIERYLKHGVSSEMLESLLNELADQRKRFAIVALIEKFELDSAKIKQIRAAQDSGDVSIRLMSACILTTLGKGDHRTKSILLDLGPGNINSEWLTAKIDPDDLKPDEIDLLIRRTSDGNKDIREAARKVFFGFKKLNVRFLAAYERFLEGPDEWMRVQAAVSFPQDRSPRLLEKIFIEAMLNKSKIWRSKFFFERLEANTELTPESQELLAHEVIAADSKEDTFALTLLRNQLRLSLDAEKLLKAGEGNPLIREILMNKRRGSANELEREQRIIRAMEAEQDQRGCAR